MCRTTKRYRYSKNEIVNISFDIYIYIHTQSNIINANMLRFKSSFLMALSKYMNFNNHKGHKSILKQKQNINTIFMFNRGSFGI